MYHEFSVGTLKTCRESFENFLPSHREHYEAPERYWVAPYRIYGNLYYVGDRKVCLHLLDTGEGLILMDTGYGHEGHLVEKSIRMLGFDPKDIRYILHTHGHFDHFGNTEYFRRLSGATVCMSAVDTALLREDPRRALMKLGPCPDDPISWPDVELCDGDHIRLGSTDITCVLAPGHTFGTLAFFFDVTENGRTLRAGFLGGAGFLTVYKEYCRAMGLPETKSQALGRTLARLQQERVDIMLGNHPSQNNQTGKREWWLQNPGRNPFINPQAWPQFLAAMEQKRREFDRLGY